MKYDERLKQVNLPTLKYRRIRGDMIALYKIFSGKYDDIVTTAVGWLIGRHVERSCEEIIDLAYTNHQYSLNDTRKFSFTNRIISTWNSLPDSVVSANTVNTSKNRLDRFRKNQEVQFNRKADIDTGTRNQVNVILV